MSCRDIIFSFLHPPAHFCRSHLPLFPSCCSVCFFLLFVFFSFSSHFIYLFFFSFPPLLLLLLCFSHCRVVLIPSLCWGMFHKIYICRYARGPWTFLLQDNLHIFLVKIPPKDAELSYECRPHAPSTAAPSFVSCLEINVNFFLHLDCLNRWACYPSCQ